ncbi:hypothetical protein PAHAL_5G526000 [Panicum hallii]|uniref:Uncharacterized protein n=1 Tax=Panicum hallii TaxID=206008 RepID=A0A2T8IPF1_9POAL|nr:hypothetical protein PAHAL_5G526000 [Panicum hallii]
MIHQHLATVVFSLAWNIRSHYSLVFSNVEQSLTTMINHAIRGGGGGGGGGKEEEEDDDNDDDDDGGDGGDKDEEKTEELPSIQSRRGSGRMQLPVHGYLSCAAMMDVLLHLHGCA